MQKQKKQIREEPGQAVHVQIEMPLQIRKTILKSAIDSTKLIQTAHEIQLLRKEEVNILGQLKKTLEEIKKLDKELNKALPVLPEEHMQEETIMTQEEEMPATIENNDEIVSLRQELEQIERKLKEY